MRKIEDLYEEGVLSNYLDVKSYILNVFEGNEKDIDIGYAFPEELKKEKALGFNKPKNGKEPAFIKYVRPQDVPLVLNENVCRRAYSIAKNIYQRLTGESLNYLEFLKGISSQTLYHELVEVEERERNRWYRRLDSKNEGYIHTLALMVMKDLDPRAYASAVGLHRVRNDWFQRVTEKVAGRYERVKRYIQEIFWNPEMFQGDDKCMED